MRYIRASSVIVESRGREIGIGDFEGAAAATDGDRSRRRHTGQGKGNQYVRRTRTSAAEEETAAVYREAEAEKKI